MTMNRSEKPDIEVSISMDQISILRGRLHWALRTDCFLFRAQQAPSVHVNTRAAAQVKTAEHSKYNCGIVNGSNHSIFQ